jgi:hypothetical protein
MPVTSSCYMWTRTARLSKLRPTIVEPIPPNLRNLWNLRFRFLALAA